MRMIARGRARSAVPRLAEIRAHLQRARRHFLIVIPVAVGVILGLLVITLGSVRAALAVLLAVPFAVVGGVLALHLRGMNLNVSGGVGFAALFGVSIMNGVLMVQRIINLRVDGADLDAAIVRGAAELLRAILMASLVAMLGLVPASLATGLGSDVQRPLATVIVWGLFGSTALTLFVVPVFYVLFERFGAWFTGLTRREEKTEPAHGIPLTAREAVGSKNGYLKGQDEPAPASSS